MLSLLEKCHLAFLSLSTNVILPVELQTGPAEPQLTMTSKLALKLPSELQTAIGDPAKLTFSLCLITALSFSAV